MFKNILVPVEPSHTERHQQAIETARALADDDALITAITVIEPVPSYIAMAESMPDIQIQASKSTLIELKKFTGDDVRIKTKVLHGHAATEINGYAEREGIDCIVVASHKPEFVDYLLGSTAARVVRHAPCSVLVIR